MQEPARPLEQRLVRRDIPPLQHLVGFVWNGDRPELGGDSTGRKNLALIIQLRWLAVAGQLVTIPVVAFGFGVALPLVAMAIVLLALVALNLASLLWLRRHAEVGERGLLLALELDVLALTAQLYLSGGATNPFVFLYILQVTLAAVLLRTRSSWTVAALASMAFALLVFVNQPLKLPSSSHYDLFSLHVAGMLVCFGLDAALLVVFVSRINRNLRDRDRRLAALRQRAAEEDHIVRMGLLASGAAHELGTPLSSLAVILGDWRRMPALAGNADLVQEIEEMQAAVDRCKSIVSDILISAGEARGDAPAVTTVNAFLADLVADWRLRQPAAGLRYENIFGEDVEIVADTALKQIVFNVLDNAFEVSPGWISLVAERREDRLVFRIADAGPGFASDVLEQVGKPYNSSKGRPGGGLGLFLVVNVVRKLGGTVTAENRSTRGALVTIELPLAALRIGEGHHHGR